MSEHGAEVGVDWANGLVLRERDAKWHPWDESVYGESPASLDRNYRRLEESYAEGELSHAAACAIWEEEFSDD